MELVSVQQAADNLGYSRQYIWMLIMMGRLEAQKVGRVFVIEANEVKKYKLKKEEVERNRNAFTQTKFI